MIDHTKNMCTVCDWVLNNCGKMEVQNIKTISFDSCLDGQISRFELPKDYVPRYVVLSVKEDKSALIKLMYFKNLKDLKRNQRLDLFLKKTDIKYGELLKKLAE